MIRKCSSATVAVVVCTAFTLPLVLPHMVAAQGNPTLTNIVPESEAATVHAKIRSIDPSTRQVVLVARSGEPVTLTAGPNVRLELLKAGDTVNAQYYRSVGFMVAPPAAGNNTPVSNDQMTQLTAQQAQVPGGIGVRLTQVSGTVVGVSLATHSIDVVNPSGGGVYTIDVTDPARIAMLSQLKVGDTVTAVISQALAVTIQPAPTSWF
jgi:Cu/Ag efflux protein CusF